MFVTPLFATTINVPASQPTIQAGINAASNGDIVLVAPDTYYENINFNGKAIKVESSGGSRVTIIDGGSVAPVVTFTNSEGPNSVLTGFTLQHGIDFNVPAGGAGITAQLASPTIKSNIIKNNTGCEGLGIGINGGSPIVANNIISRNTRTTCSGGIGGGGIAITGLSSNAQILRNTIVNNKISLGGNGAEELALSGQALYSSAAISSWEMWSQEQQLLRVGGSGMLINLPL